MLSAQLKEAQRLVETGRLPAARIAAQDVLSRRPELAEAWLLLALIEQRLQDHEAMLVAARHAARLQLESVPAGQKLAEALLLCGFGEEARGLLRTLEARVQRDARALTAVAGLYASANAHLDRLRCAQQALRLAPTDLTLLEDLSADIVASGLCDHERLTTLPLSSGMRYFRSELDEHILRSACPAGVCHPIAVAAGAIR